MELKLFGENWPLAAWLRFPHCVPSDGSWSGAAFWMAEVEDVIRHLQPVGICPRWQLEEASWIASMLSRAWSSKAELESKFSTLYRCMEV
jgi:hypothetical protein